jgi:glycosyltransferase involved in cell wall biosynthesis
MNILFLAKFYSPFDRGGSEWSTRDLAYLLTKDGHQVTVITPNFGTKSKETIDGIKIIRIPFPIKLKNKKNSIAPFWTNNLVWFIYSSAYIIYICIKNKYEIIHIQNNEFITAGVISAKVTSKKTIATFRDYQVICNLGFCLWSSNKACRFGDYIKLDFNFFYNNYVSNKNVFNYFVLATAVLRSWLMQKILFFISKKIDYKIAVSKKVKEIFKVNGLNNMTVINNAVIVKNTPSKNIKQKIIYVGKLSNGKGVDMLVRTLPSLISRFNNVQFEIIGAGYLRNSLMAYVKTAHIETRVKFMGHLDHTEVLKRIAKSALVVVPSLWPDPLPRSVIETILSGTPVVACNVGGISEIVGDNKYGLLTKTNKSSLENSIAAAFEKQNVYRKNIKTDIKMLRKHFTHQTLKKYEKIYMEALN